MRNREKRHYFISNERPKIIEQRELHGITEAKRVRDSNENMIKRTDKLTRATSTQERDERRCGWQEVKFRVCV